MAKTATIINETGIHTRPGGVIVAKAKEFKDKDGTVITLEHDGKTANAHSLLKLLGLGIKRNSEVIVTAQGPSAEEAEEAMANLLSTIVD